jgi:glycosyltransferase involved in cell wall biosynthesis
VTSADAAKQRILIQVGPARAPGGIADVMRAIDEWARRTGQPTRTVNTSYDGSWLRRLVVGIAGVGRAIAWILVLPHSLVHVHSASYGSFARKSVVVLVASSLHRPVVLHIHGAEFSLFVGNGSSFRRAYVSTVLKRADIVLVLNAATKQLLSRLQPLAVTGVLENPATLVCGLKTNPGSRQVLFLGRLEHRKGIDLLLEAIRTLQAGGTKADFVLAGDGATIQARAVASCLPHPERVRIPGWIDSKGVHQLLHESSIFCLPSRNEGLPMALLQAMGHGLACVVTPVGGMGDLVEDGETGRVVPEDDCQALSLALGELLDNPGLRKTLGQRAYALVRRQYAPDIVMKHLDDVYRAVLTRRGLNVVP